jgi:hypothetical protein
VLEFTIGNEDYKLFERFASTHHLTRDAALRAVLIRGMEAYWPQQLAETLSDYSRLRVRMEQFKRDNDLLNKMHSQNCELERLLKEKPRAP